MRKTIDFTEKILEKIEIIRNREGHATFSATVMSSISNYFDSKYFSKWKESTAKPLTPEKIQKQKEDAMTDQQYCEYLGGEVRVEGGRNECFFLVNVYRGEECGEGMLLSDRKGCLMAAKRTGKYKGDEK